jgi:hypothetical protein
MSKILASTILFHRQDILELEKELLGLVTACHPWSDRMTLFQGPSSNPVFGRRWWLVYKQARQGREPHDKEPLDGILNAVSPGSAVPSR